MLSSTAAWDAAAVPVILGSGTLLHFAFEWSGRRRVLAVICPINESVWEHVKMAYWPLLLLTGVQAILTSAPSSLPPARAAGAFMMAALILGLYALTVALWPTVGIRTRLTLDGTIFIASVVLGQWACHLLLTPFEDVPVLIGWTVLAAPIALFVVTTFAPPRRSLFRDQLTGEYGFGSN